MKIAVVAHDAKKGRLLHFVLVNRDFFSQHILVATEHTAELLVEKGFNVEVKPHGPQGGDILIAAMVVQKEIGLVFFFRDLLSPQAHEHDISALLRMADMKEVPVAINWATAECLVRAHK